MVFFIPDSPLLGMRKTFIACGSNWENEKHIRYFLKRGIVYTGDRRDGKANSGR